MLRKRPPGAQHTLSHTCWAAGAAVCGPGRKGSRGICSVSASVGHPWKSAVLSENPRRRGSKHACFVFLLLFRMPGSRPYHLHQGAPAWAQATPDLGSWVKTDASTVGWAISSPDESLSEVRAWLYPGPWLWGPWIGAGCTSGNQEVWESTGPAEFIRRQGTAHLFASCYKV